MSKKTTQEVSFPAPGMMFPMPDPSQWDWSMGFTKSGFKSNWEKSIDRQKSYMDGSKDQYDRFFENMGDLFDSFAESLPEELPWMPTWAKAPKAVRKEMKEWEEMANEYFKEIASTFNDFVIKSQEMACAQIPETEESAEEKGEVIEVKAEVKTEAKPAAKAEAKPAAKTTTKTAAKAEAKPAAKTTAKPAAKAEEKPADKAK